MSITEIARPADQLVTAAPNSPVRDVARYMQEQAVGSVVVVDEDEPVGIVTDRDLALAVINRDLDFDAPVKGVMTRDPTTVRSDATVTDACRRMKREKVRRLPIVEDGALVGIVSADDILAVVGEQTECLTTVIEYECPAP